MPYSLCLQYPYHAIEIAICLEGKILKQISLHKFLAVGQTIPTIQQLLEEHNLTLENISFFGVNVGPAPYNTLRALLTMINAIHRVTNTSIITLNALDLISAQYGQNAHLVVLQAFENHVFYKFQTQDLTQKGACSIAHLISLINQQAQPLTIYGNGATKYQTQLQEASSQKLIFPVPTVEFNELATLASHSYEMYRSKQSTTSYIKPIYFEDLAHI